jgi:cell wall integrity and stress response component
VQPAEETKTFDAHSLYIIHQDIHKTQKMTRILTAALTALLASTSLVAAQATATSQSFGAIQTLDCYDTLGSISDPGTDDVGQSSGICQETCVAKGAKVMVTSSGSTCYCGDTLPPPSAKVDSDNCNVKCAGYGLQTCGGVGYYQFYLTGMGAPKIDSASSSESSSASSSPTSSATSSANTAAATTASATPEESSSGGGSSKVGIAVGVVVGIVALAAIAGVGVFLFKRRRRQQLEAEHARTAAINGFVKGSKSETSSANDSRLDPSVYSHRRESIGSIADERDFSRRILQV